MAPNSLSPAFVEIAYHSDFGAHVQTIPTLDWDPTGATYGFFDTHTGSTVDAETMIDALIALEKKFFPTTVVFDSWTIFTKDTPTSPSNPRVQKNITVAGTVGTPGWFKAAQATWTFKTDLFGEFKIVNLDVATLDAWDKITSATASADQIAFIAALRDNGNGWAGRDGGRPEFFQQIAFTLNEKLRREYRMN